jgi:hypothetical protein
MIQETGHYFVVNSIRKKQTVTNSDNILIN